MTRLKPTGGLSEWYAIVIAESAKQGMPAPAWDTLSGGQVRAWTLAYASQLEMAVRMVDAIRLTIPGLMDDDDD